MVLLQQTVETCPTSRHECENTLIFSLTFSPSVTSIRVNFVTEHNNHTDGVCSRHCNQVFLNCRKRARDYSYDEPQKELAVSRSAVASLEFKQKAYQRISRSRLIGELLKIGLDCLAPDAVAIAAQVQVVRHEFFASLSVA